MDIEQIWSAALSVLALTTNYLAGNGIRAAWMVGMASQAGWLGFIILTGNTGFLISFVGFTVIYIRNYLKWSGIDVSLRRLVQGVQNVLLRMSFRQRTGSPANPAAASRTAEKITSSRSE